MTRWLAPLILFTLALPSGAALAQVKNADQRVHDVQAVIGKGATVAEAKRAARCAAVDQVVKVLFARTEAEWSKYQAARAGLLGDLPRFIEDLEMTDKYQDGGLVVVEVSGRVLKEELKERLEALGVIKSIEQAFTASTLPQIAVVFAPDAEKGQLDSAFAAETLQQHLTHRKLAVGEPGAVARLATLDRAALGGDVRSAEPGAASDIVLRVSSKVVPTELHGKLQMYQAEVEIQAFINGLPVPFASEVYKSRELAFATIADQAKSQRACVEEAIGGAVEPLMQRVLDELRGEETRGKTISLSFTGEAEALERAETFLSTQCAEAKPMKTPGGLLLIGRYHGQLTDLLEKLNAEPGLAIEVKAENSRTARLHVKCR